MAKKSAKKKAVKPQKNSRRGNGIEGWEFMSMPNTTTGRYVTRNEAMNVSTVFRCIAVLTDNVSTLPAILYRKRDDDGKDRATDHPLYRKLKFKPNKRQNATEFYSQMMMSLLMRGNAYIQKAQSRLFEIQELGILYPDFVTVQEEETGNLIYKYYNPTTKETREFNADEIIHIRAMAQDGILGLSPLDCAIRTTIGTTLAAEEHGGRFFSNSVTPSGVLQHPAKLSAQAAERLKKDFQEKNAGANKAGGTLVLEEGMEWKQMSMTNEQSQFLETRKFQVVEICRWFGVPPHKVAELERATFSNIEQQALEFITDSLRPWLVRIEMSMLIGLFPESEWDSYTFEFLTDALLRGDTTARFGAYATGVNNGFMNLDEVRAKENMNPLPDGLGKKFRVPLNMQILGEPPPQQSQPGQDPNTPDNQQKNRKEILIQKEIIQPIVEVKCEPVQVVMPKPEVKISEAEWITNGDGKRKLQIKELT